MTKIRGPYDPERPLPRGSLFRGCLGALLGALAGAIPYGFALMVDSAYAADTDLWEAVGFFAGYCACVGYQGFRGRRSTAAAYGIVITAVLVTLAGANLAAEVYTLGAWGAPQIMAALGRVLGPEKRKGFAVGLFFAFLGVWSVRRYLLWYTDIETAIRKYGEELLNAPAAQGPLPRRFTVRNSNRREGIVAGLCAAFFAALLVVSVVAFDPVEDRNWLVFSLCFYPLLIAAGIYALLRQRNYRLEVEGEYLCYTNAFGIRRDFYAGDIYGLGRSPYAGHYQLFDREGWRLGWFDPEMENGALLVRYLRRRGIGANTKEMI